MRTGKGLLASRGGRRAALPALCLLLLANIFLPAISAAATTTPSISSDKADYAPGEAVTLTGAGWQGAEAVHLRVNDDEGETWSWTDDVTADDNGGFTDSLTLPNLFVATYNVTATGALSGTAATSFTDKANATINPASKNFGTVNVGSTGTAQTFTIGNNGDTGLNIQSVSLTGTNSSEFTLNTSGLSMSLAVGATTTLSANFAPLTSGGKTANIMLNTNANDLSVTLSGSGVTPPKRSTSASVSCTPPTVNTGVATSCTATVTDTDAAPKTPPTGPVSFASSGSGTFASGGTCSLSGSGASTSCAVSYTQGSAGTPTITATYGGDATHSGSAGTFNLTVTTPAAATSLAVSATTGTYGGSVGLSATLTSSASGVANKTITFSLRGSSVGSATTTASGTATLSGVSLGGTATGTYPTGVSASFAGDASFAASSGTNSLTVNKAPLSVLADNASRQYGNANPAFTGTITGVQNGDNITASYSTTAGATSTVGSYTIAASLNDPDSKLVNYTVTSTNGTLSVTRAPLTVSADDASRTYGDSNPSFHGTLTGIKNSDPITASYSSAATAASPVGTYPIVPTLHDPGSKLSNYDVTSTNGTLSIGTAAITVKADDQSRQYGEANPTLTGTLTGVKNADDITATYTTSADAASSVGSYAITPVLHDPGNKLSNYAVASTDGSLTVTRAPLTVNVADKTREYGDANPSFTGTITGIKNADDITASYSSAATPASDIGGYAITASLSDPGSKLGNYQLTVNDGTLSVTRAPLAIVAEDQTKTYGDDNPALTSHLSGFKNADTSSVISGSAACSTGAVKASPVGNYLITCNAGDLSGTNYSFTAGTGTLRVNPASLTVSADDASRMYGNANPGFGVTYTGFVLGEGPSVLGGTLAFDTAADASSPVGSYDITASGLTSSNYDISFDDGTLTVTRAPLSVTAANNTKVYGETNPTFTGAITGLKNSDDITATYGSAATASSPVGTYPIVPTLHDPGSKLSNYDVTSTDGTLTVTRAPLSVSAADASRMYGNANPGFGVTYAGFVLGEGPSVLGGTLAFDTAADASSPVGSYDITASGLTSSNYDITFDDGTLSVTRAPLTVSADDASRTYGDSNPSFHGTLTGIKNSDPITASYSSAATAASPVGTYPIVPTLHDPGSKLSNYDVTSTNGTLSIGTAAITVKADDQSRQYGEANPTLTGTLTGVKNADDITATYTTSADAASSVGSYAITPVLHDPGNKLSNYAVASTDGSLTVTRAPLTVNVADKTREYGDANPSFTGTITGIKNADDITASYSSAATPASDIGGYAITASLSDPGSKLGNYQLTVNDGTLSVTRAPLAIVAEDQTKTYGDDNPALTSHLSGFKNADTSSVISGSAACSTGAVKASPVGNYLITCNAGDLSGTNYSFTAGTGTLRVNPASLTVSADDASRMYGNANPGFGVTYTGFVLGEGPSVLGGTLAFDTAADASSPVGSYDITASGLTSSNYDISFDDGTLTVTRAPLSVTAANNTKVYGETNPTFTGAITGLKNSDDITATYGSAATASSPVGTYPIVPTLHDPGSKLSNYDVTSTDGTLTVTRAPLSVSAADASRMYGNANPGFGVTYAGFVLGEGPSVLGGTLAFDTAADASSPVGSYDITASGLTSSNYDITFDDGTLSVTRAPLAIVAEDQTKTYGDDNPALTSHLSGFKNADTSSVISGSANCFTGAVKASPVGNYLITCNAGDLSGTNYSFTAGTGTLRVTAAPLTVTASDASRPYGDSNPAFTGTLTGIKNADAITATYGSAATAASPVGTYPIVPTLHDPGSKLGNYDVTSTNGTLTVIRASLGIVADGKSRQYGAGNPSFTGTITGIKNSDNITASYSTVAAAGSAIGSYAIVPSPIDPTNKLGNYDVTLTNGTLAVTPAPLTVTPSNATRLYADANPAFSGTIAGIQNGDNITASYSTTAAQSSPVGAYNITASLADPGGKLGNYALTLNTGTLTVTRAPLSVIAADKTKVLGAPNPTLTGALTGLKNGDNITADYTTTATQTSPIGTAPIVPTLRDPNARLTNYLVTSTNGTLTIVYATGGSCQGSPGHTILQPINPDGSSVFKQGSTVPAKFRVCDANGNSIGTADVVTLFQLVQRVSGLDSTAVNEAVVSTTPDSVFRWDSTGQQWIFNINTKPLKSNTTYVYQATLNDGTLLTFQFGLK